MKKTLSMLLAALLVAAPGLAYQELPDGAAEGDRTMGSGAMTLGEAIEVAAEEVVASEATGEGILVEARARSKAAAALVQGSERPGWKLAVGIGLLAGGAGLIARGLDLKEDEPDRFGRRTDSDAYFAMGLGGAFIAFGAFMLLD